MARAQIDRSPSEIYALATRLMDIYAQTRGWNLTDAISAPDLRPRLPGADFSRSTCYKLEPTSGKAGAPSALVLVADERANDLARLQESAPVRVGAGEPGDLATHHDAQ